jgi:hypothetical protein
MALLQGEQAVQNNAPAQIGGGSSNSRGFKKSDRLINFNIPTTNEDGSQGHMQLAVGGLHLDNPAHQKLIAWLDKNPDNLYKMLHAMADSCTYVDLTKPKERSFGFMD